MSERLLEESNIHFDFSNCISVWKADKPTYNGLGGVDFVVELEEQFLFLEVKNIDNPKASTEQRKEWLEELKIRKNNLYLLEMGIKFKDTILRKWAMEESLDKPIFYIILLQLKELDAAQKIWLSENLIGRLPNCFKEKHGFKRIIEIKKWDIVNVPDWNTKYPQFPATEIS